MSAEAEKGLGQRVCLRGGRWGLLAEFLHGWAHPSLAGDSFESFFSCTLVGGFFVADLGANFIVLWLVRGRGVVYMWLGVSVVWGFLGAAAQACRHRVFFVFGSGAVHSVVSAFLRQHGGGFALLACV